MSSMSELYNECYAVIDQGICFDEVDHREGALAMYERALQLIQQAEAMPGSAKDPQFAKMNQARTHVLSRLSALREPAVERPRSPYAECNAAIDAFGESKLADELFVIPYNVQIFYIDGDDTSVPSYPTALKIFKFRPDSEQSTTTAASDPPAFMQVGEWVYPLVPACSPSLLSTWGAYLFPNPTAEQPNLFVGVLLPQDLDRGTVQQFEQYLKEYTIFKRQEGPVLQTQLSDEERTKLSTKLAKFLIAAGDTISWGVEKGASKAAVLSTTRAEKYRQKLPAAQAPANIDPRLQTSVHYLRKGAKVAVKVSGYLVNAIGEAAVRIGQSAASSVERRLGGQGTAAGGFMHDTFEVIGGGVAGVSTVWMTAETASKQLAKSIANDTVNVVQHRYGPDAATLTNNALYAAGHSTMAAFNIDSLGFKAIAKRTAKHAGLGLLKNLGAKDPQQPALGPAPARPPPPPASAIADASSTSAGQKK